MTSDPPPGPDVAPASDPGPEPALEPPFDRLPFVDEHRIHTPVSSAAVWDELTERIVRTRLGISEPFARLLDAEPARATGTLFEPGSTVPGFAVAAVVPGRRLVLTGQHRFSRYALVFVLTDEPDGTLLRARTLAEFPGPAGWGYRQLVIGSGGHKILVGRMVRSIGRAAERR
jgi:hypothetical protein